MKRQLIKKHNKYYYKWKLEFEDWLSLVVVMLALNCIMIRLIVGAIK